MTNRRQLLAAGAAATISSLLPDRGWAAQTALSPPVRREFDNLLRPALQPIETGYHRLENGLLMTSALHKMVGCKWHMVEWFVKGYTEEEYKMFHPDHISVVFDGDVRRMTERIGGQLSRAKFQLLNPADYYDSAALAASGVAGVLVSRMGPYDGPAWSGLNCYAGRDTGYGCEMRNRYFLGDTRPSDHVATEEEKTKPIAESAARGLAHILEEFAYLAGFLPALYARKHPA